MKTNDDTQFDPFWIKALSAERNSQSAYSKFYFELRSSPFADELAAIRMSHGIALTMLEKECIRIHDELPETIDDEFFADDPREEVFGIDPYFVIDFLKSAETRLFTFYLDAAKNGSLPEDFDIAAFELILNKSKSITERVEKLARDIEIAPHANSEQFARVG